MNQHLLKVIFLGIITFSIAQQRIFAQRTSLSINKIMEGQDFTGYWPEDFYWSEDGSKVYFEWNPDAKAYSEWYALDSKSREVKKVSAAEYQLMTMGRGIFNKDRSLKVYAKSGDLFLKDIEKNKLTQLTHTNEREQNPFFSSDEKHIVFERDGNIYTWQIETGQIKQWSDFKDGKPRNGQKDNERDAWLKKDQLKLFEVLRDRKKDDEASDAYRETLTVKRPKEIYSNGGNFRNIQMSPNMKYITFTISKPRSVERTASMEFVNESGYARTLNAREKVGAEEESETLYIYQIEKDTVIEFDTEALEGIFQNLIS